MTGELIQKQGREQRRHRRPQHQSAEQQQKRGQQLEDIVDPWAAQHRQEGEKIFAEEDRAANSNSVSSSALTRMRAKAGSKTSLSARPALANIASLP